MAGFGVTVRITARPRRGRPRPGSRPARPARPAPPAVGAGRSAGCATSARSGSRRAAPLSARPPPIRTRSTPVIVTVATIACGQGGDAPGPTRRPRRRHRRTLGRRPPRPRPVRPVRAAYSRSTAAAEAITSRHPVAAAPAGRPGRVDDEVPQLAGPAVGADAPRPSSSSAPAMPVPTGRNSACRAPRGSAQPGLGQQAGAHVVADDGRYAERRRHRVADRQVAPAEVHREHGRPRAPRPPGRARRRRSRPAAQPVVVGRRGQQLGRPSRRRPRRCPRRCPAGSASTAA